MKKFEQSNLIVVRQKLQSALDAASKELGMTCKLGNIKYSANEFSVTLKGFTEQSELERNASKHPLIGTITRVNDKLMTIVDFIPNRYAYPFVGEATDGRRYKLTQAIIQQNQLHPVTK